jgi:hypothetical protein
MMLFAIFIVLGDVGIHGHFRGCIDDFILRCYPHAGHPLQMTMIGLRISNCFDYLSS